MRLRRAKRLLRQAQVLMLQPGDALLVSFSRSLSQSEAHRIAEGLRASLGMDCLVVIDGDPKFSLIREVPAVANA